MLKIKVRNNQHVPTSNFSMNKDYISWVWFDKTNLILVNPNHSTQVLITDSFYWYNIQTSTYQKTKKAKRAPSMPYVYAMLIMSGTLISFMGSLWL